MRATRKDVAKKAGVSTATVSYVLNNTKPISQETRQKVMDAVKAYNYLPDMIARSMGKSKTMQLGILINDIFNQFFSDIINEFENEAIQKGYLVNICTANDYIDKYLDNFVSRRLDGVLVMASPTKVNLEKIYRLNDYGTSVLISGNVMADTSKVSLLEPDYKGAMEKIIDYLASYGHTKIAYLSAFNYEYENDTRLKYFVRAYDNRFEKNEKVVITGKFPFATDIDTGYEMTRSLLDSGRKFSVILATNDSMAIGCMDALAERNIKVPEKMSVMGIDNILWGKRLPVPLTTVSFDKKKFAADAFNMLYDSINNDKKSSILEEMFIIERKSVALYNEDNE